MQREFCMMRGCEGANWQMFDFNCMAMEFFGLVGLICFLDHKAW